MKTIMMNCYGKISNPGISVLPSPSAFIVKLALFCFILFWFYNYGNAQAGEIGKTKIIIGLSTPEMAHVGMTYRISNLSQLGVSVGAAPSWGETFTTISLEHRLYFGNNNERSNQKTFFTRQGTSFFLLTDEITLNLSVGKDFIFKNINNGFTMDFGVLMIPQKVNFYYNNTVFDVQQMIIIYPAIRFQFYFAL